MGKPEITITISAQDQQKFNMALRNIATYFSKNMYDIIKQLAIYAAQSARKMTPIGKKKRPVRRSTREDKSQHQGRPYMMEWYDKQGNSQWRAIDSAESELRIIKKRGAGKGSWSGILSKLGSSSGATENQYLRRVMDQGSLVTSDNTPTLAEINITNKLGYISKLVPNIEDASILLAEKRLLGLYMKKAGDDVEKIWSST